MKVKVYDTVKAAEIIRARMTLANLRDDFRGMVRDAKLAAPRAKRIMDWYNDAYSNDIAGEGSAPDLHTEEVGDEYHIYTYDVIDPDFGIGAIAYSKALEEADGRRVVDFIKSPGGYVEEGRAINTMKARYERRHDAGSYSVVDAIAASAATTIALGFPRVEMGHGTEFMIHRSAAVLQGGYMDMDEFKGMFDRVDRAIAGDYVRKTGMDMDEVLDMMTAETFMSPEEAIEKGFADGIHGEEASGEEISNEGGKSRLNTGRRQRATALAKAKRTRRR